MATRKNSWRPWLCGLLAVLISWGTLVAPFLAAPAWAEPASYSDMAGHLGELEVNDLAAKGILDPSANPSFRPDSPFLRGDFLALLAKACGITPVQPDTSTFTDLPLVSLDSAPIEGMAAAALDPTRFFAGIATPDQLAPSSPLTVAQGLAMIVRSKEWEIGIALPQSSPFTDVPPDYWAYREIVAAQAHGLIFQADVYPDSPLTRWLGAVYLDRSLAQAAAKSIHVSLADYDWSLYMVEGAFIVRTFPVLTGQKGMETPLGNYTVLTKVPVTTMVGADYSVPNVRWCLFFIGRVYAIHGNYWKPDEFFGQDPSISGSHGCVGLIQPLEKDLGKDTPAGRDDAKILYNWAEEGTPITITDQLIRDHFLE